MVSQAAARLISASWAKKSVAVVASRKQSCARWRHSLIVLIPTSSIHARLFPARNVARAQFWVVGRGDVCVLSAGDATKR
jgi:hypothetical protein